MRITDRRSTRKKPNLTAPQRHFPHSFWFPRTALPFGNTYPAAYGVAPAPPHGKKIPQKPNCGRGSRTSFLVLVLLPFRGGGIRRRRMVRGPLFAPTKGRGPSRIGRSQRGESEQRGRTKKARPKSLALSLPPALRAAVRRSEGKRQTPSRKTQVGVFLSRRLSCISLEEKPLHTFVPSPFSLSSSW